MNQQSNKKWLFGFAGILLGALLSVAIMSFWTTAPVAAHDHGASTASSSSDAIWTCSMHPQIRQSEPGDCAICGMDLIQLEENTSNDPLVLQMTEEAIRLMDIQTTVVGVSGSVDSKTLRLSGTVQVDERLASSQVAHVPGRIEKLYVTFTGEQVTKGQKLADLYVPELITAQRELLEARKMVDVSPGLLTAARNKLRYWKVPEATITRIEEEGTIQETFTVLADESGIVTNKMVAVGDYVRQGEPLFALVNLSKVWVLFEAYEDDLAHLKLGDRIEFTTPAIPNRTFNARITFIDPVINPRRRTASLRTEVDNQQRLLKPEMLVYGNLLQTVSASTALMIPKSAVLWTGPRSVVYVKMQDAEVPSFQYREVEIGEAAGGFYPVISGLASGEEVVTYGGFAIDAAAQLNNQASMMNQEVTLKKDASVVTVLPDYATLSPAAFKQQLADVVSAYLLLKDALVASDVTSAETAAQEMRLALNKVDMALLKGDAHLYWMEQLKALQAHSEKITTSTDLEVQRQQFDFLSQSLIQAVKVFGTYMDTLYVQHCPMAFDDNGADWLSAENKVLNPYFGEAMLRCGIIEETIVSSETN
ncbi:efflux RND transporter periplasmic adaptor subunit [Lewinella cohaerens]|uniref:efflux RND transporter periplasmic adaptor subunit n=1 Tax=Lewinella cohaerens TaxID=70995 RepID=UPI000372CC86|nr:efflux RND transporter periplasmic adaptor subunit [Lewinella cohaerens]